MAGIVERIQEDQKAALKARERDRVAALRLLSSELKNRRIELGRDLTDEDAIEVLSRALKQRRESEEQFVKGGRADLATKEAAEAEVIRHYLPEPIADDELNRLVIRRIGTEGVAVLRVTPGSPAAAAGLQGVRPQPDGTITPGDIIVAVDGSTVEGVARLLSRLDDHRVGDTVRLTVLRDGRRIEVDVTLQGGSQ